MRIQQCRGLLFVAHCPVTANLLVTFRIVHQMLDMQHRILIFGSCLLNVKNITLLKFDMSHNVYRSL